MNTKTFKTDIAIELDSAGSPDCMIKLDDLPITFVKVINGATILNFNKELIVGPHRLSVEHLNKQPNDPDTALIIKSITFNGITSPKFVWRGIYTPNYPEPWASTQTNLAPTLTNTGYLGWNGAWQLNFTAPIFTWIHQVEDLGWIHS